VNILLAGCGDLGQHLGELLSKGGYKPLGVRRSAAPEAVFPVIQADLLKPDSLRLIPEKVDLLVYTATPAARNEQAYRDIYVNGLKNCLARLDAPSLKRIIMVSSTAVYHQQEGQWVDEDSPTCPTHFSGQVLLEAEQLLAKLPVPATVVRFGGIYGPGRNRLLEKVTAPDGCEAVKSPPYYTNRIHRDDCVGVLQFLIERQRAGATLAPLYLGVDRDCAPQWDVLCWLAKKLDVPMPREKAGDGRQNKRCNAQRLLDAGYRFKYESYQQGYLGQIRQFQSDHQE